VAGFQGCLQGSLVSFPPRIPDRGGAKGRAVNISIAMATYNGAKYLQEQLDSFLSQTRRPDELVVCDDDSTDATLDILDAFRRQAPFPVRIFRNETTLGYYRNFEKALSLCEGDIIFLSDQDDVWFSNKIAEMARILSTQSHVFVLQANMVLTDDELRPSSFTQLDNILSVGLTPEAFVTGCGTALRREWLAIALPFPAQLNGHDNWIHRLARSLDVRMLYEDPLQYYRRHDGNASNWKVSRPFKTTFLDDFWAHGFRDATTGWQQELERARVTWSRLDESTSSLSAFGLADRQKTAMPALNRQINAMNNRLRNAAMPRHKRLPRVVSLWMRGGYGHLRGWKSVVKDVLRPQVP
jgi:glycosyltransferase involved in cell wall biosynthesis